MQSLVAGGLAVLVAVGLSVAACSTRPRWRRHTTTVAALVLTLAAVAVAGVLWSAADPEALREWGLTGRLGPALALPVLVLTCLAARAAFLAEGALLAWRAPWRSDGVALPPELLALNLPARAETMRAVGRTARSGGRFWTLSGLTVSGEELLYRVVAPALLASAGQPLWVCLGVPAALYALNHIGFGLRSILGKLALGLVLGAGALACGALLTAVPAHLLYQYWVRTQFTSPSGAPVVRRPRIATS